MMIKERASLYRGVYKCGKKWKSQIQIEGIQYYLGVFGTEQEASDRYNRVTTQIGRKIDPADQPVDTAESIRRCLSKMHADGKDGKDGKDGRSKDGSSVGMEMSPPSSPSNGNSDSNSPSITFEVLHSLRDDNFEGRSADSSKNSNDGSNNSGGSNADKIKVLKLKITLGQVLRLLNNTTVKYVDEICRTQDNSKDHADFLLSLEQQIQLLAKRKEALTAQILNTS